MLFDRFKIECFFQLFHFDFEISPLSQDLDCLSIEVKKLVNFSFVPINF